MVIRDSMGVLKCASSKFMDSGLSGTIAELKAIFEGILMVTSLNCGHLMVESDCLEAINLVTKKKDQWGEVEGILEDIWALIPSFAELSFSYSPRKFNVVADVLAKRAKVSKMSETLVWTFPSWLVSLVKNDLGIFAHVA